MMAARWRVPEITITASPGSGSTWIGIQQPPGGGEPFIQVGTTDFRDRQDYDYYDAFWSDTVHRFRPVSLFRVQPGDLMVARLVHIAGKWQATVEDNTLRTRRVITTTQEGRAHLQQAEWFQEDPGTGTGFEATGRTPYATTNRVRFSGLWVNRTKPTPDDLIAQNMRLRGSELVPSRLVDDSFIVRSKHH